MNANPTRKALQETSLRVFKKLLVLLLGVAAFFGLRALENMKADYYKEKAEPIIIVQGNTTPSTTNTTQPTPTQTQALDPEYVIKLERQRIEDELTKVIKPSPEELKELDKDEREGRTDHVVVVSLKRFRESILKSIPDARRNPFVSEDHFITYLSENIGKAKTDAEELISNEKKNRLAEIERLRVQFAKSPAEFASNLKNASDTRFNEQFDTRSAPIKLSPETDKVKAQPVNEEKSRAMTTNDLATAAKTIENDREARNRYEISEKAYETRDGLYSIFATTFLTKYIKDRKKASPHPSTFSEMVLDEKRGGYVVYQVFYLAGVAVLVFGILFPIYLLLRAMPPFSASVDPLTDRAKDLLSRQGVAATLTAPEIVKSVALSAAAIGLGAAVVIANNPVTAPKDKAEEIASDSATDNSYPGRRVPNGFPTPRPGVSPGATPTPSSEGSPTPSPDSTPVPDINVYPTFHQTFTADSGRLSQLESAYGSTQTKLDQIINEKLPSKRDQTDFSGLVTSTEFTPVAGQVEKVKGDVQTLMSGLDLITKTEIPSVRKDLTGKTNELSTRLDATNTAVASFREGTQGPSLLKRASELLGRERYQPTPQSVAVLTSLLCPQNVCASGAEQVLVKLNALVTLHQAPMRKNTFLERLGIARRSGVAPSPWEALILRYSRVQY
jgi:hypothetical protein